MSNERCLLVFRVGYDYSDAARDGLQQRMREMTERLKEDGPQVVIISDEVHAYWLKPGQSTVEMDACADAIRAETLAAA